MTRPTRLYKIRLGPAVLPVEKGYEILTDLTEHHVMASHIKYVMGGDMAFVQLLNNAGDIVFTAPSNMVLSIQGSTEEYLPKSADVIPLHGQPVHLSTLSEEEDELA